MENKLNIFVLEDSPERIEWFKKTFSDCDITHTDQVEEACERIREEKYDLIFLDRDLGDDLLCGEELSKVMMEEKLAQDSCIIVHTVNPWGMRYIRDHLKTYHRNFHEIEFFNLIKRKREDFKVLGS